MQDARGNHCLLPVAYRRVHRARHAIPGVQCLSLSLSLSCQHRHHDRQRLFSLSLVVPRTLLAAGSACGSGLQGITREGGGGEMGKEGEEAGLTCG